MASLAWFLPYHGRPQAEQCSGRGAAHCRLIDLFYYLTEGVKNIFRVSKCALYLVTYQYTPVLPLLAFSKPSAFLMLLA